MKVEFFVNELLLILLESLKSGVSSLLLCDFELLFRMDGFENL